MSNFPSHQRMSALLLSAFLLSALQVMSGAASAQSQPSPNGQQPHATLPAGTILRVGFKHSVHPSDFRSGGALDGELADPLYLRGATAIAAGEAVHLQVAKVNKNSPHRGTFSRLLALGRGGDPEYSFETASAAVTLPNGALAPAQVEFLRWAEVKKLRTKNITNDATIGGESVGKQLAGRAPGVGKFEEVQRAREQYERHRH